MEVILRVLERKYGKTRRIWLMDRGIVSGANPEIAVPRGSRKL
jgi:hypothetical protein